MIVVLKSMVVALKLMKVALQLMIVEFKMMIVVFKMMFFMQTSSAFADGSHVVRCLKNEEFCIKSTFKMHSKCIQNDHNLSAAPRD